jgi:ribonuclease R
MSLRDLSRRLKLRHAGDVRKLERLVNELTAQGVLSSDNRGKIAYVSARQAGRQQGSQHRRLVGRLRVTRRGFGMVRIEGSDQELSIAPKFMKTALHGDIVAVVPFARSVKRRRVGEDERIDAEIVEIVRRTNTTVVGTVGRTMHFSVVVPDDQRFTRDIYVSGVDLKGAEAGDKVVVQLLPWEDEHLNPEGRIIEVLGPSGDARVEVTGIARSFGLPPVFPEEVNLEAQQLPSELNAQNTHGRMDFRNTVCFTIDPDDAKDFDDAISYQELPGGTVRLGVHIADVSHYVREQTALDAEALRRGTSVYLVNEVIPMLPERLSNDLCSLRPDVDRLTFSVLMDVTPKGEVEHYQITEGIIRSARRFTYEEVHQIIQDRRGDHADRILPLFAMTQLLLKSRRRRGSIDFDTPEAKFRFDMQGFPSHIVPKHRLDSHRLVEECMLLANNTVARHVERLKDDGRRTPFVYRVHDVPDPGRLRDLSHFIKQFGLSLDLSHGHSARALQRLLDKVDGSELDFLINEVVLRSMAKAVYSEKNIGHYGLGYSWYTHFTSPIRRYPDLIVHRILKEYVRGMSAQRRSALAERLPEVCRLASERERIAQEAERTSVRVMQAEFMKRHVGDEFDGVIGGVTDFGVFVEISELLVEGLVRVRDMLDDYYLFDEKHYSLKGRSRGRVYRLGDKVRVRVVAVRPEEREIELALVE